MIGPKSFSAAGPRATQILAAVARTTAGTEPPEPCALMSDKTSSRHEPWLLGGVAFILLWLLLTVAWPGLLGAQPADPLVEAQAHLRAGKAEEALIIYEHMVEAQPQNLEAHKGRANALGRLGRYADALEEYARVVASKPEDVEAHIGRARILGWMGRYCEAEAECRRVLTDNPNVVEAYLQLGTILGWQRKYSEAAALFERARQLAPHDPESCVG